ncbi:MAG: hypothetical protein GF330_07925 [Candidatus Eisenbacteria bacterium]|nr:hypothetical protein [Candidatus Eisenbacteria bacterium]
MAEITLNFLAGPTFLWWIALPLAIGVGVWAYFRLLAPLGVGLRALLRFLRVGALVLLLLLLLEPVLGVQRERGSTPRLAVLIDRSSSMALPGTEAPTRREEAAETLARIRRALGDRFELQLFSFAGALRAEEPRLESAGGAPVLYDGPAQGATAIGEALEELLLRQSEIGSAGILMLSDGTHTAGKDPTLVARNLSLPIFSVCLGESVPPADWMIRQVKSHPLAYAGEPTALRAVLESSGATSDETSTSAALRLRPVRFGSGGIERGAPVAEQAVRLSPSAGEREVSLELTPRGPGLQLYELALEGPGGDEIAINNRRWVALEVREKKTRLLYLEGEPDWDFTFLRRVFDADTTLSYAYLVRQTDGSYRAYGDDPPASLPRSAADLAPYAGVILGRLAPQMLPEATRTALEAFVGGGGGLLFLDAPRAGAGIEAWHRAGWGRWLPLLVAPSRRHGFELRATRPTMTGLTHEITLVADAPAEAEALWRQLPPIWTRAGRYERSPGATVLLQAIGSQPPVEIPLLTLPPPGSPRVAVLAGRGFWRWDFVMRSISEGTNLAPEFWRRMARWLSEPLARERFVVHPMRRVFQDGEPVVFHAQMRDADFDPVGEGRIRVRIEAQHDDASLSAGERSATELTLYPDGSRGGYSGTLHALPPGTYRYRAAGHVGHGADREAWRDEGRFWVEPMGAEYLRLASSPRTLETLAEASGGYAAQLQDLPELIRRVPRDYRRARLVHHFELWNHWSLFAFVLAILSIEWVVRRRQGLA